MADHLAFLPQLRKEVLGRKLARFFLIAGDIGGVIAIAYWIPKFLPPIPDIHHAAQIWVLSFLAFWLFTYEIDSNFPLDSYLTYARVLKITCFTGIGYLLFFVLTREFYSLTFLLSASFAWTLLAVLLRWSLNKLSPPLQGLALEAIPTVLEKSSKVCWTVHLDPKKINDGKSKQFNLAGFDFLLIDFRKLYPPEMQELLTHAHVAGLRILSTPQLVELLLGKISIEHFNDFWVEATFYLNPVYLRLKRIIDLLFSLILLPLLIPLALLVALSIFIFMGRPILYWQERMGLDDKLFKMVKFRTMIPDAENKGFASTSEKDDRVTWLGAFLRKMRLDELPQFYNVIKGDMSIIGPRPEYSVLVEDFVKNIPLFQIRHWLRPGITGWAQVNHGYVYASSQEEMCEKIRYDLFYLKNLSLWLDLIIVIRTFVTILTGFGSR